MPQLNEKKKIHCSNVRGICKHFREDVVDCCCSAVADGRTKQLILDNTQRQTSRGLRQMGRRMGECDAMS